MTRLPEPTTADAPPDPLRIEQATAPPSHARVVAQRYELIEPVGQGGFGTVWSAHDRLSGSRVAVKFWNVRDSLPTRIRREVAALRLLRVPGVVPLLDEGRDGDEAFLVMEQVAGTRFPGCATPASWESIEETVVALLETLALVHAYGVVHRDLKPSNILVDARGRPTLLDFGIAHTDTDVTLTGKGQTLGTPAYLAPEQISGEPIGPTTDLYALGTMLFEILSGELPFGHLPWMALAYSRAFRSAPPLAESVPTVPSHVAEAIDAMLRRSPADRPRSASEVIERLRGGRSLPPTADGPIVRDEALLHDLLARVRAGRPVDVVGMGDNSHTRTIREAARVLADDGREVLVVGGAQRPFASLVEVTGRELADTSDGLGAVAQRVEASLRARLADGVIVVVDDTEQVDRWSLEVLERVRSDGVVVRGLPRVGLQNEDTLWARPLGEGALRALIAGPDRVLHLQADGARLLRQRSGGSAVRAEQEARTWIRAGLARWDGSRLVVRRDDLERIEATLRAAPTPTNAEISWRTLPGHLLDLLAWVTLAWPRLSVVLLAEAMHLARWEVEAGLEDMIVAKVLRRGPNDEITVTIPVILDDVWPDDRTANAHRALALVLPPGSEGRLMHFMAASRAGSELLDEIAGEGVAAARRYAAEGRLGRAEALLREALLHIRRQGDCQREDFETSLLTAWVDIALAQNTPHAIDRVLYEITRTTNPTPAHADMEALARAAISARTSAEHSLTLARALPALSDPRLEWWRHSVQVIAARRCSVEDEEQVLQDVAEWADRMGTLEARASLWAWQARLRYRQNKFDEAAELWLTSARDERHPERRLSAMTGASSALLEAGRLDEAEAWARVALDAAQSARHAYFEARAEWLLRATQYRQGKLLDPDIELVAAVAAVGVSDLEALVCLTEAAVAWRRGSREECTRLAERVVELWSRSGWTWPLVLPRSLALNVGETPVPDEPAALVRSAIECPDPAIGIQAMGLLATAFPSLRDELEPAIRSRAAAIAVERWDARMEVISVREALAASGEGARGTQLPTG